LPPAHVQRTRLFSQLDAAIRQPLTLLVAPAGWGKSILLSSWASASRADGTVAWVGFDATDGFRAWHDIVETLTRAGVRADGSGTGRRAEPAVVILDDFHQVADRAVLANVERLLQQGGDDVRVILATRHEPLLPLYRWRLAGQLSELRTEELSFTHDEATDLLRRHGLDAPRATVRALVSVTEGWPAGLTLAARAMSWSREPDRVADELGLGDQGIADYLDREVLDRLPDGFREVLMYSSIVEYACPGLVEALTGRADGARVLGELERSNAFVVYSGGAHAWYRYRRLLRRCMYAELRRVAPERLASLHAAASGWYARNGQPAEALRHALAAGDWDAATGLLDRHWPELLTGRGQASQLAPAPAPPESVSTDARLALAFAAQRHDTGDVDGMRAFVRQAEQAPPAGGGLAPVLHAAQLAEAHASWDADRTLTSAARLLGSVRGAAPATVEAARAMALTATADAAFSLGQLESAEAALRDALPLARRSGPGRGYVAALRQQAVIDLTRGRLGAADHAAQLVLGSVSRAGFTQCAEVAWSRLILGGVSLAQGRLDEAAYHLDQAMSGAGQPDAAAATMAATIQARLRQLRGDPAGGLQALAVAWVDVGSGGLPPLFASTFTLLEAELRLALGDVRGASRLVPAPSRPTPAPAWTAAVRAKLHLANGDAADAAAAIGPYASGQAPASLRAAEACLLHARALRTLGNRGASECYVERALRLADVEGLRLPFLVNAALVRDLLVSHLASGTAHTAMIAELTGAEVTGAALTGAALTGAALTGAAQAPAAPPPRRRAGVDPLTEREIVVLRHLRSMMSTAEIASMLCVSANTVKTHVKNVYRKLGVSRRRDAVRRAQEVGLI
jgi:LuxR family maltose regulon positive regulatory protein